MDRVHRHIAPRPRGRLLLAAALAALCCSAAPSAAALAASSGAGEGTARSGASSLGPIRRGVGLGAAQQHYLALAEHGAAVAMARWHDRHRGWYDARLGDRERYPLATIWDIVPLFESLDAIAIAQPSAHNLATLRGFARGAARYLNRGLRPIPGYSPYPGDREASTETWFDDNGWWGLAFVNAYRATGTRRYLIDAERALRFIAARGWEPNGGGIWWNTTHLYKAGEALASATLLATLLYEQTHSAYALARAHEYIGWADTAGFSAPDRLYAGSSADPTPIDYIEGPLIYAQAVLCRVAGEPARCTRAETLAHTSLQRFGYELDFSPQYDAIYLQWMLALYALDGDATLYRMAAQNAADAASRALNSEGLYLRSWKGEVLPARDALPNMLQTQAATTSLFAWLAVYTPPAG